MSKPRYIVIGEDGRFDEFDDILALIYDTQTECPYPRKSYPKELSTYRMEELDNFCEYLNTHVVFDNKMKEYLSD